MTVMSAVLGLVSRLPAQDVDDLEQIDEATASLTTTDIAIGVGALVVSWPLALAVGWLVKKALRRTSANESVVQVIERLTRAGVVFVGLAVSLSRFGVDVGWFTVTLLFTAGLVFLMLRPLAENFAAGLLLETRSSYSLGDEIETNGFTGEVVEVNGRTTVLKTRDWRRVHIPSSDVLDQTIVVYTGLERRRSTVELAVDDRLDLDQVSDVLIAAASSVDGVFDEPGPVVRAIGFGNGTVIVHLNWWHAASIGEATSSRDAVVRQLAVALPTAGIRMPAPQIIIGRVDDH